MLEFMYKIPTTLQVLVGGLDRITGLRMTWCLALALPIQIAGTRPNLLSVPGITYSWVMPLSYCLLLVGTLGNVRLWGFRLLLVGLILNILAIASNGWQMPVSPEALTRSGLIVEDHLARGLDLQTTKSQLLAVENTRLPYLTDRFLLSTPMSGVFSLGDFVILSATVIILIGLVKGYGRETPGRISNAVLGSGVRGRLKRQRHGVQDKVANSQILRKPGVEN